MTKAILLSAAIIPLFATADIVLWFTVDSDKNVENTRTGEKTKVSEYTSDGHPINAARVAYSGGSEYAALYFEESQGRWVVEDGLVVAALDNGGAKWQPASLGTAPDGPVTLELGYYDFASEMAQFVMMASATEEYANLLGAGHVSTGGVSLQPQTPWTPSFTAVPEPSGALLVLLGLPLVVIRRRLPAGARHSGRR